MAKKRVRRVAARPKPTRSERQTEPELPRDERKANMVLRRRVLNVLIALLIFSTVTTAVVLILDGVGWVDFDGSVVMVLISATAAQIAQLLFVVVRSLFP